ncbi:uncharacterized protein LOC107512480 isoform X2 [Rousettus aegyptiacus]|nr:uncharacterized protein LOC107512480 isoform X2 [Rousettus aegyptiacus]
MNRTLNIQLGKLCQETHLYWDEVLTMTLLRIRSAPTKKTGFSSYEISYGQPPPLIKGLQGDLKGISELTLKQQLQALGTTFQTLNQWVRERLPVSLTTKLHPLKPGDSIWVKEWNIQPLKSLGRGPFTVILSTPTTVKVAEITPRIHHSRHKPTAAEWECVPDSSKPFKATLRKKTLTTPTNQGSTVSGNVEGAWTMRTTIAIIPFENIQVISHHHDKTGHMDHCQSPKALMALGPQLKTVDTLVLFQERNEQLTHPPAVDMEMQCLWGEAFLFLKPRERRSHMGVLPRSSTATTFFRDCPGM